MKRVARALSIEWSENLDVSTYWSTTLACRALVNPLAIASREQTPNFLIGPVMDVDLDVARRAFETDFFASMRLAQLVIPYMVEQGGGPVVNIGSISGNV